MKRTIQLGMVFALGLVAARSHAESRSSSLNELLSVSGQAQLPVVQAPAGEIAPGTRVPTAIAGHVTKGPTCGGPERPGRKCYVPLSDVEITICPADGNQAPCRSTSTDANGDFFLNVPSGNYKVTGENLHIGIPRGGQSPSRDAIVSDAGVTTINLNYDTGIR